MSAEVITPVTGWELEGLVRSALDQRQPMDICGGLTKSEIGPVGPDRIMLNLSSLRGVDVDLEGGFAIAQAGTPVRQLERELERYGRMLPFEPPDYGPLFGGDAWGGTVGGLFLTNTSGSRSVSAGPASRNLKGCALIDGHGETRRLGWSHGLGLAASDVMQAVAGSWGMFGVVTELAFSIVPMPDETASLVLKGLPTNLAVEAASAAVASGAQVTGATHIDRGLVPRFWSDRLSAEDEALTIMRIEARQGELARKMQPVRDAIAVYGETDVLSDLESTEVWSELQSLSLFQNSDVPLWRLTVPADRAADILEAARACLHCAAMVDWAGGLIWLETDYAPDAGASDVRRILAAFGGAGMLVRAEPDTRQRVDCFQPLPHRALAVISDLKAEFDPHRVFNAGRVYAGI